MENKKKRGRKPKAKVLEQKLNKSFDDILDLDRVIASNSNVGIGYIPPNYKLEVKPIGIGDVIEKIAKPIAEVIGLEDNCDGCEQRRKKLNKLWSFYKKPTDEDISFLKYVFEWYKGLPISPDKVNDVLRCEEIWMRLANVKTEPCRTCGAAYQNNYMDKLKEIYENYI